VLRDPLVLGIHIAAVTLDKFKAGSRKVGLTAAPSGDYIKFKPRSLFAEDLRTTWTTVRDEFKLAQSVAGELTETAREIREILDEPPNIATDDATKRANGSRLRQLILDRSTQLCVIRNVTIQSGVTLPYLENIRPEGMDTDGRDYNEFALAYAGAITEIEYAKPSRITKRTMQGYDKTVQAQASSSTVTQDGFCSEASVKELTKVGDEWDSDDSEGADSIREKFS
jgi:hypothetical protein